MSSLGVAITVYGGYKMATAAKGSVRVQPKPSVASSADDVLPKSPATSVVDNVLDNRLGIVDDSVSGGSVPDFYVGPNGKVLPRKYENWIGDNLQ